MKRPFLILALSLSLAACKEDAPAPLPIELTEASVGYFCQMNLLDHGGPKAQVHLDTYPGRPLFFSQVRDAVAYLRLPEQDAVVTAVYVTDMGSVRAWDDPGQGHWITLDQAVLVVGSDRMGGMDQPDFIPFATPAGAEAFIRDHGGQVMTLAQIPDSALVPPEAGAAAPTDDADYAARLRLLAPGTGG